MTQKKAKIETWSFQWSSAGPSCADGRLDMRLEWWGSYMDGFREKDQEDFQEKIMQNLRRMAHEL